MTKRRLRFRLKATEDDIHITFVEWCKHPTTIAAYPELAYIHHSPNGGLRHKAVAAKLWAMGVNPGFPDLFLPIARHGFHGWFAEIKRPGGYLTSAQTRWISTLRENGYYAAMWDDIDDLIWDVKDYLDTR